jgi:hypothetical protein
MAKPSLKAMRRMYANAQNPDFGAAHNAACPMKPKFTDAFRYQRGYVRSESTDVAKTWAAAREKLQPHATRRQSSTPRLKLVREAGSK